MDNPLAGKEVGQTGSTYQVFDAAFPPVASRPDFLHS
jgi:hypothetical protein